MYTDLYIYKFIVTMSDITLQIFENTYPVMEIHELMLFANESKTSQTV